MSQSPSLISVRSDVAASLLIDGMFDEAVIRAADQLPATTETMLTRAGDAHVARLGYLARVIELERFEVARVPVPWLLDHLVTQAEQPIVDICLALAADEPLAKSAPGDGAPTWRIPGPGGHVRHFLAVRAFGDGPPELKRSWLFGFLVRCCEDIT